MNAVTVPVPVRTPINSCCEYTSATSSCNVRSTLYQSKELVILTSWTIHPSDREHKPQFNSFEPKLRRRRRRMRSFSSINRMLSMLFLLLVTVITTTYAIPIQLHGLNYNTRKGPDWDWDKCKTRQEILTDLTMLSRFTTRIRLLSLTDCGQGELVLSVARELGLQLWLGLWVAPQDFVFQEEKGELIGLLERNMIDTDTVLGITVGSEAIYRNDTTVDQVIGYMNEVYELVRDAGLDLPVSIVDIAPEYAKSPQLRAAVNVTMTNTFPFWEAIPIEGAVDDLQDDLAWLLNQPESRNKPFVLGETGWPSDGFLEGVGVASPELQRQYFQEAFCKIDVENQWAYYWFTGIDNAWRQEQDPENTIEGNWGFLYANLTLKPQFEGLEFVCSDLVTYSFAEIDWSIPEFTPAPATMDPASCQAHGGCSGLFGNCCPDSNGVSLNCCDFSATPPMSSPPITTTTSPPTIAPAVPPPPPSTANLTPSVETSGGGPTPIPTLSPTNRPTALPTGRPTNEPTDPPTGRPSTDTRTDTPTILPTTLPPTLSPVTSAPTMSPTTPEPTLDDASNGPTASPTTQSPSIEPSLNPTAWSPPTPKPTIAIVFRPSPTEEEGGPSAAPELSWHCTCWGVAIGIAQNLFL